MGETRHRVWSLTPQVSDDSGPGDVTPPLPGPVWVDLLVLGVGLDGHHLGRLLHHLGVRDGLSGGWGALLRGGLSVHSPLSVFKFVNSSNPITPF